jgi:hypothetical protein
VGSHPFARKKAKGWGTGALEPGADGEVLEPGLGQLHGPRFKQSLDCAERFEDRR